MTDQSIELVAGLVLGQKHNGKAVYDAAAKDELVRRAPGLAPAR